MHLLARTGNMTRKTQNPTAEDGRSRKRVLKPVVEKKRRDRINQSLAELRSLLLSQTSDARLQNPKVEKAEILDMAVEYLQKWTDEKKRRNAPGPGLSSLVADHAETWAPVLNLHLPDAPHLTMESAGFHQCVAQLTSYMQKITPSQRVGLIEGLKHHTERQQTNSAAAPISQRTTEAEAAPRLTPVDASERRDSAPNFFLFPSLSPPHPMCSTPCHEHTSPPPSPWLSPCFSTFATSPSFPSFGPHFSSPHSLSPLSSNTSFFTFSPVAHHTATPAFRYPPHPVPGEGSPPNSSLMWRPWC